MGKKYKKKSLLSKVFKTLLTAIIVALGGSFYLFGDYEIDKLNEQISKYFNTNIFSVAKKVELISLDSIPEYDGTPYVVINENNPFFTEEDIVNYSYEKYTPLDELGRCGVAISNIGKDLMPTEPRGAIGMVKPSGWQTIKFDFVDGKYLYNRCHLIGYQLTAENANRENLITGTRYLNVQGMLPFENMVADYIKETSNHVLYRVTPIYEDNNLVASGVLMEARSYEDEGKGILFNVYCYNVQPNVKINYLNGEAIEIK